LASTGETGPPCGVPSSVRVTTPFSMTPACSHLSMSRSRAAVVYPLTEELSKPVVPDVVEVAGHGNLYNVLGPVLHHPLPQPVQRRVRATSRSETMRAVQESCSKTADNTQATAFCTMRSSKVASFFARTRYERAADARGSRNGVPDQTHPDG
jgi:hypothetical protein